MDEAVPRSPAFSANASRSNVRTEVHSKKKFNGVGGTQTYLSFAHSGFHPFSKHQSAGDAQ
jgi:hypothetical protein